MRFATMTQSAPSSVGQRVTRMGTRPVSLWQRCIAVLGILLIKLIGITVPNPDAQVRCVKTAYHDAGLDVDQTAYVECHGTGTKVGDWRELKAISESLCARRSADKPMYVGSIKPNIGHLEGSAGVAGMIKAILIAEKGQIPPHINFENWNPDIKHDEWKVDVSDNKLRF